MRPFLNHGDAAHIFCLPIELGPRGVSRTAGIVVLIGTAHENRCSGGQIEDHSALAWLD